MRILRIQDSTRAPLARLVLGFRPPFRSLSDRFRCIRMARRVTTRPSIWTLLSRGDIPFPKWQEYNSKWMFARHPRIKFKQLLWRKVARSAICKRLWSYWRYEEIVIKEIKFSRSMTIINKILVRIRRHFRVVFGPEDIMLALCRRHRESY